MRQWIPWLAAAAYLFVALAFSIIKPHSQIADDAPETVPQYPPLEKSQVDQFKVAFEKVVSEQAQKTMDTELLIVGGSIAILLGTGYHRPPARKVRLSYVSFLLGWAAFAQSMYFGYKVRSIYLALLLATPKTRDDIVDRIAAINASSILQAQWFYGGLSVFACWLIFYLGWWILSDSVEKGEAK